MRCSGARMRLRLLFAFSVVSVAVACGGSEDDVADSNDALTAEQSSRKFNVNQLLEDDDILGAQDVTADQVQSFLESKGSALAKHTEGGKSAAQWIVDNCRAQGISVIYMLARIQTESSLVESKKSSNLDKATGCACPDGKKCSASEKGFGNQITCAASLIRKYFTQLNTKGESTSGYRVNKPLKTLDPCSVTPKNRATVALYTYTPWVGEYGDGCGTKKSLGSSGVAFFVAKYKAAFPNAGKMPITDTSASTPCDGGACEAGTSDDPSACVPKAVTELCEAAVTSKAIECGFVEDGCGGFVNCDSADGFGCKTGEQCSENRCVAGDGTALQAAQ
jgi:hypothetical protein